LVTLPSQKGQTQEEIEIRGPRKGQLRVPQNGRTESTKRLGRVYNKSHARGPGRIGPLGGEGHTHVTLEFGCLSRGNVKLSLLSKDRAYSA